MNIIFLSNIKYTTISLLLIPITLLSNLFAQDTISYSVTFPNLTHHEAEISIFTDSNEEDTLFYRMSTFSPGRYSPHFFAKNIYNVSAYGDDEEKIPVFRQAPDRWYITGHLGPVHFNYTLFANHPDGTYSGIDQNFVHLNIPSAFIWIEKKWDHPVKLSFDIPDEKQWITGTQLKPGGDIFTLIAEDYDYFMDSPIVLADAMMKDISLMGNANAPVKIKLFLTPDVPDETSDGFLTLIRKTVLEQRGIFGDFPDFDYGEYIFLCNYDKPYFGDGMEHRNSTMITSSLSLQGNEKRLIGTISHEFFHVWNVEHLRPVSLQPFNFTDYNMSDELWFAEGFTLYYGNLTLCRAGIYSLGRFLENLENTLNYVINIPGREIGSPEYMSRMATFIDGSNWVDDMDTRNTTVNYYNYGMAIALGLDLTLRSKFPSLSLDDYMKKLWLDFGREERPYTSRDLEKTLAELTKDPEFAGSFFESYIRGNQLPDYAALFEKVGIIFNDSTQERAYLGSVRFDFSYDSARVVDYPLRGSPVYKAGLSKGDYIISIDRQKINGYESLFQLLDKHIPGDSLQIIYSHQGSRNQGTLILDEVPDLELIPFEQREGKLSRKQERSRESWLDSKAE